MSVEISITDQIVEINEVSNPVEISVAAGAVVQPVWGGITGTLSNQTDLQNALNAKFDDPTGTTAQYLRGDGTLATFPTIPSGTVTSVGLTMPSAFSVANSPVTSSGTLAVTGAGTAAQYIRGDGQLANFPDNQGGGSSVNYYLNGSVTQGTFGGVTYYEMSKTPVLGAGTNFTRTNAQGNGYIASFITDAGDPSLLNIPGGNWNVEFYFQSSSTGGSPQFYAELYKVDASNNFTLVGSGSANPEGITNGTTVDQYYTAIPVPQTSLLVTDRLAIRIFVIPAGRTITLHTENSNLCEVLTTLSTGLNALNGLTAQVQYFATGSSGTDFNISSATDTHTFNLPTASGTNRGLLSSADWTTFNSKQNALTNPITGTGSAGQVAYFTGATTQAGSNNLFWDAANTRLGIGTNNPLTRLQVDGVTVGLLSVQSSSDRVGIGTTSPNSRLEVNSATGYNVIRSVGASGGYFETYSTAGVRQGSFGSENNGDTYIGSRSNNPLIVLTNGTERARIFATGNFGINTGATDSGQRLQVVGTGYFSDSVGIGNSGSVASSLRISKALATGNTIGIYMDSQIQSTLSNVAYFQSEASTSASAITVTNLRHFFATQPSVGAGSTITNQYGFFVQGTMTGATNDYAFYSDLAAGTNIWNLYMNGTANNYMAGSLGIGQTTLTGSNLRISKAHTGSASAINFYIDSTIQSDVTNSPKVIATTLSTQAAAFTVARATHYLANQGTIGAGSTITTQVGFEVDNTLIGATINYGFFGNIASGTNRWNLYMNGTAANYLNGNTLIGSTTDSGEKLQVTGTAKITGASSFGSDMTITGSGTTNGTLALLVRNSSSTNILGAYNDRTVFIGSASGSSHALEVNATANASRIAKFGNFEIVNNGTAGWTGVGLSVAGANRTLQFLPPSGNGLNASDTIKTLFTAQGTTWSRTSGNAINFYIADNQFAPTSGTATYFGLYINGGVNQTGGASGISRGLYIDYNIVAAADFRAIEITSGTTVLAASVTARASLRIPSGTAPTSPVNGDIWFDGTDLKMRIGGVTKTFTLV